MSELIDPSRPSRDPNRTRPVNHVKDLEVTLSPLTEGLKEAVDYDKAVKHIAFELSKEIDTLNAIQTASTGLAQKATVSARRGKLLTDLHKLLDSEQQKESDNQQAQEIAARIIILAKQAMIASGVSQDMVESTVQIMIMNMTSDLEGGNGSRSS